MICAHCGNQNDDPATGELCPSCESDPRLRGRYLLREVLGQRGSGTTYLADDDDRQVVVKELLLRRSADMKEVELFQREASLQAALDVDGVPAHVEHFEVERGKTVGLYNVQEYIDGVSLEEELARSRPSTTETLRTLADVLEILAQLREQEPPVVHRDIKPANLIRRASDGKVFLVDFGVARAVAESLHFAGSTVTGTFGYMAPEQLYGHAEPASDVYAAGATAIRIFTGREPHDVLDDDRRFAWRDHAEVDADIADTIDAMTAWDAGDRPSDLMQLATDLRARADGTVGALARIGTSRALVRTSTSGGEVVRPSLGSVFRELQRDPEFKRAAWMGAGALVVGVVLTLGAVGIGVFQATAIILAYALVLMGGAVFQPRFRQGVRRLHRYRTGRNVRGIIVERTNDGERFKIRYRYDVEGETHTAEHPVSSEWYFSVEEGDEVEVFYNARHPELSAIHPVAQGSI